MNKKLTLSVSEWVIKRAKEYAKKNDTSVSKIIESYLYSLIEKNTKEIETTPLVESLSGVIELPEDYDYRSDYTVHILEKYR